MSSSRAKIEKLLHQLDLSESGGVDAALAAGQNSAEIEDFLAGNKQGHGITFSSPPHGHGHASDDDTSIVTDDTDQGRTPADRRREAARSERYAYMEKKALQLMSDNKALALALEQTTRRKDMEIKELQAHITTVVKELEERHREVEAKAPLLRLRADELREHLRDLRVSDARYSELKTMPQDARSVVDEVKMAVYEETSSLRQENERLRLTIASTREMAARAEEDAARLRVENARVSATLVEKEKDLQIATDNLQARVDRLASELEASLVRCELLSAKGQMYDELRAKTDKLHEENQRLQVVEMGFKRLEEHSRELQAVTREKEHTNEMLLADKAYLAKQVDLLTDVQQRLQSELETKDATINELQRKKQELFDKLIQTETLKNKQEESRMQRELAQLQSGTQASIERIRIETGDAYEREARLLRELRDQAQDEAARTKVALKDIQAQYEELQIQSADAQRKLEAQVVELQAELRTKTFEITHINVIMAEKEALLQRSNIQNDLLQEKLQISLDQYRALDAEVRAAAAAGIAPGTLPLSTRTWALPPPPGTHSHTGSGPLSLVPALAQASGGPSNAGSGGVGVGVGGGNTDVLRYKVAKLEEERATLVAKVKSLEASLQSTQSTLKLAGQPHAFILEQLQAAKTAAQEADMKALAATTALKAQEQVAESATRERDALRSDLELLLQQRGQLDSLKATLIRTLGGGGGGAQPAQLALPGAGTGRTPPAAVTIRPPTTTIAGER